MWIYDLYKRVDLIWDMNHLKALLELNLDLLACIKIWRYFQNIHAEIFLQQFITITMHIEFYIL